MAVSASTARSDSLELVRTMGFEEETARLTEFVREWIAGSDNEVRKLLEWQFLGGTKHFRPVTIFACHAAVSVQPIKEDLIRSAAALHFMHNVSLIIDDILDRSRQRRGRATLHCRFGTLPALMTAGYINAAAFEILKTDAYGVELLAQLLKRLGVAECLQWRIRRHVLGVEDWRWLAGEDTGTMFETCACLGTRGEELRQYGRLLGTLYHGCDDVGDVRGATALGGGGDEDIRDGILTLPAAIAIRDPRIAIRFRNPAQDDLPFLMKSFSAALPAAEKVLDLVAEEAIQEAEGVASDPQRLITLVRHTRRLSKS